MEGVFGMPDKFKPADFGIGRLFSEMSDGVVVADAASELIVLWNGASAAIFGYPESEAIGLELHSLVPERFRDAHRAGLARYQGTGSGPLVDGRRPVELVGLRKDGSEVPIELTLTSLEGVDERGHRFALAIVRDITDRRQAEDARVELQKVDFKRRQALEVHDRVVQSLVVAKIALEGGQVEVAEKALATALDNAKSIVGSELEEITRRQGPLKPGDLRNRRPET